MGILIVHGNVSQQRVGVLRAMFIVCRDMLLGYKNTLITGDDYSVKVTQDPIRMMTFEVDTDPERKYTKGY